LCIAIPINRFFSINIFFLLIYEIMIGYINKATY
jgi:hypothetical protein